MRPVPRQARHAGAASVRQVAGRPSVWQVDHFVQRERETAGCSDTAVVMVPHAARAASARRIVLRMRATLGAAPTRFSGIGVSLVKPRRTLVASLIGRVYAPFYSG